MLKVYYGIPGNYIDVTTSIMRLEKDGMVRLRGNYNDILGDPISSRCKHLRIDHPRLEYPVYVKEGTPLTMRMGNKPLDKNINIVYFLNTKINKDYIYLLHAQMEQLKKSGILSTSTLYVEAIVDEGRGDHVTMEIESMVPAIVHTYEEHYYEYHGIYRVWLLSQLDSDNITLYFHSKGISHIKEPTPTNCRHPIEEQVFKLCIDRWLQNISLFSIFPSIDKLGHSTGYHGWIWHNFFWARGSYISRLEEPTKTRRRHYYEDWLCRRTYSPLPYTSKERLIDSTNYDLSISNCYGYFSSNRDLSINIGEYMDPSIPCYPTVCPRRPLLKIDSNVTGRGLFNQLNNLCNSIVIAHYSGRDIYIPHLDIDLNRLDKVRWSSIIDIDRLHEYLRSIGIHVSIIEDEDIDHNFHIHKHRDMMCYHYNFSFMPMLEEIKREKFDIDIGCSMVTMMEDLSPRILQNIVLVPRYRGVVEWCIGKIGTVYDVVHLRCEDDWVCSLSTLLEIDEDTVCNRLYDLYKSVLDGVDKDSKVLLCTYLTKSTNRNDWMVESMSITDHYTTTLIPRWREHFDLPNGREIDALIDYMVALNGRSFVGYSGSTFSHAIDMMMKSMGRPSKLVSI